jgi:oligosaccharide repeat unit polymerase
MPYFFAATFILIVARILSESWRKVIILPWVVVTTPILVGAGLANLNLVPSLISPWSPKTHALVITGTVALLGGSFTLKNIRFPLAVSSKNISWNEKTVLNIFIAITIMAIIASSIQFLTYGSIPLFSADPDKARLGASRHGYLNVFSILPGHMIPVGVLVLLTCGERFKKSTRVSISVLIATWFILQSLWFARGMLLYPLLTAIAVMYILKPHSFGFKKCFTTILIIVVIFSGMKYYRDSIRFGGSSRASYGQMVGNNSADHLLGSAVATYLIVTINYSMLNQYVSSVPALHPHSTGRIMAGNALSYLPGAGKPFTELEFQNKIFRKNEYTYTLTSTFFGVPYIEFGTIGVLFAGFIVGLLYKITWQHMFNRGTPFSILFYACLVSMAPFMIFSFLYTSVNFTWLTFTTFLIVFLCQCRIDGISLYHRDNHAECG